MATSIRRNSIAVVIYPLKQKKINKENIEKAFKRGRGKDVTLRSERGVLLLQEQKPELEESWISVKRAQQITISC
jgi:hypothetical protein